MPDVRGFLVGARVDPAVFELRPDYRALLIAVDDIDASATGNDRSNALLIQAETAAATVLGHQAVEELPHVAAWRDAYRSFGAKPQRTRCSVEALLRRASSGLPRINRITDIYNAISVIHQLPIGGEDLSAYRGSPRLIRSTGTEPFDTVAGGAAISEHPVEGEVVWCDDAGVTCRRWNWRQGRRTQLTERTTAALFILDVLDPITDDQVLRARAELVEQLRATSPDVRAAQRLISASTSHAADKD